ncbi:glycerophosphoinositol permease [Elasticomyces elasticus]|nr:glycerophosphoinositol permease [Elasticomyces elasticus]KAK4921465.1 glycerophosphoinositol permease [Elasticomyces elasticus]
MDEKNNGLQTSPERDLESPLAATEKSRWERTWPALACGAGLFSDGYLQAVIGPVNTILGKLYPNSYATSAAAQNVSSIAFAGTVVGQLVFGYTSDHYSRKWSLLVSTGILVLFAALSAGSYGAGGSHQGLFAALTAFRFLLGIGIGGEYPAGSVGCAEASGELKVGHRNRWFCLFTNTQIDLGFVIGTLVPMIITAARPHDLGLVWRLSLGLGVIPPLSLLYLRLNLKEPESVSREAFRHGPGDNIGLVASKTCATGIRGQYYAIAAATGKIGAFVGGYVFPVIEADGGGADTLHGGQYPFYVASALCFFSAFLVFWLPQINQDTIQTEDVRFREYLVANGYDITGMGSAEWQEKRAMSVGGGHDASS